MMNLSFRNSDIGNKFSLKDQEKLVDEMKRENFDLKLKLNQLQEKLSKISNGNLEKVLDEREQLAAKNEALVLELKQYRDLLEAARVEIEEANQRAKRVSTIGEASEVSRLSRELEGANVQIAKLQGANKKLEGQNKIFEDENKELVQKIRQLELDYSLCQRRLSEARNKIEVMENEINYLEDQNKAKEESVSKFRQEVYGGMSEFNVATRQISELQNALSRMQAERGELIRERDTLKRAQETALSRATPMTPGNIAESPRSSIDGFELMLNKKVSATEKAVRDMEKTTVLSKNEKDQLETHLRQMSDALNNGIGSLFLLSKQIIDSTGIRRALKQDINSLPEAIKQLEELCSIIVAQTNDFKEQNGALETLLQNTSDTLERAEAEKLKLNNQLRHAEDEVHKSYVSIEDKNKEFEVLREECKWLKEKSRRANDEEIPSLKNVILFINFFRNSARSVRSWKF
jgi:chromosome segregation ATPase